MPKLHVVVTAEHIQKGTKKPAKCPVALALIDAGFVRPYVTPFSIRQIGHTEIAISDFRISAPSEIFDWIADYDSSRHVEPFEFDIEVPDEATR